MSESRRFDKKMSPSCIPLLFLLSVYLDNDWAHEQEEGLLDCLTDYLMGRKGLSSPSLEAFVLMIEQEDLKFTNVDMPAFLRDQVMDRRSN